MEVKAEDYDARGNLSGWLTDGRSQYVVRSAVQSVDFGESKANIDETQIFWNDSLHHTTNGRIMENDGHVHREKGKSWTELVCAWSPYGNYLATFHNQGIVLWGGDKFERIGRFQHQGVRLISFSPKENYLITCNLVEAKVEGVDPECIIVWDVHTQKKLRGFAGNLTEIKAAWPVFKWSHDDSLLARIAHAKGDDVISVYQVPDMSLLDKKSIRIPDVGGFEWCPGANILAYHVPEKGNTPAKVSLLELPSKNRLREVHLYSVTGIKLFWQDRGDYLAVQMTRHKTKKTTSTHFEIFRVKTKDIPVENLDIDDQVIAFQWEPKGHRFAVIHSDSGKTNVSVYELNKKQIRFVGKLEDRPVNSLFWSPKGDLLIIASLGPQGAGTIECIDVDVNSSMYSLGLREHYMCRDVEWDPTGRFVITSVCQGLGSRDMREKN